MQADGDVVEGGLRRLAERPVQDVAAASSLRYRVEGAGPFDVFEGGDRIGPPIARLVDVVAEIDRRCTKRAEHWMALAGWLRLRGAVASIGPRRILVLGRPGAGVTSLVTRLLHDHHRVDGDATALLRDAVVLAFPQVFRVPADIGSHVPELERHVDALPRSPDGSGKAFSPA
ncbi:MAG: hypothetical protein JO291_06630, partial [Acidimicrobiia bacterium]|nr:hypothetical protein [Acidimicrobiia bacterium]